MTKLKLLPKILISAFALIMPTLAAFLVPANSFVSSADSFDLNPITIENGTFENISYDHSSGSVNGWSTFDGSTGATMMILDVEENFDRNFATTYFLKADTLKAPKKQGNDNKILMINSANTNPNDESTFAPSQKKDAYISNPISLQPYSYYSFSVSLKTASFNNDLASGSIYLSTSGTDEKMHSTILAQEGLTPKQWTTYYFFLSTGSKAENITIDLWLGTKNISSPGVVFFDSVVGYKISQNYYETYYNKIAKNNKNVVKADDVFDRVLVNTDGMNFDFENNNSLSTLVGWEKEGNVENANAKIIAMNEDTFTNETKLAYDGKTISSLTFPGDDFSLNNKKSLVMYANDGYVSVKSQPIEIKQFAVYKITARVKPTDLKNGGFTITLRETDDMKKEFDLNHYTPDSQTLATPITAEGTDSTINYYNEVSMFIKGQNRYDSKFEIILNFGSKDEPANGGVVVDNITIEYVNSDECSSTDTLTLTTLNPPEAEILNGAFNNADKIQKNFSLPVAPASFTLSQSNSQSGIINVYKKYFDSYSANYGYEFAKGIDNPGAPDGFPVSTYANNVFMFFNKEADYQSLTSSTFKVEKDVYRKLSFKLKTLEEKATINVKLIDSDGYVLFNNIGVSSPSWSTYECLIRGGESTTTITLVIEFGDENNPVMGHAFLDDIFIKTLGDSELTDYMKGHVDVDLSNLRINLDPNGEVSHNISSSTSFTGSQDSGASEMSDGGIIDGNGNDIFQYRDKNGEVKFIGDETTFTDKVLVIYTSGKAGYSLTSVSSLSTTDESYYALKFRLLTSFPGYNGKHQHTNSDGEEEDVPFGLKVEIDGFEAVENLQSNEGWQQFTIIFNSATAQTDKKLKFSLASDCLTSAGYVYITDISWEISDKDAFESASKETNSFTSVIANEDDEQDVPSDDDAEQTTDNGGIDDSMWLLIPSIIMAVAVIVAVVGFSIRHIKVKKIDKKRKEEYDRTDTLLENEIANEAKKIQQAEIEAVNKDIASLQEELKTLEEENKLTTKKSREEGKVTKEIERQFKSYAQKSAKLQKSIDELNEHKALISSPDYLLSVEKRVRAQRNSEKK